MFEIIQNAAFARWLANLKDHQARMRIHGRLDRLALGNLGDAEPIGGIRPWLKNLPGTTLRNT